MQPTVVQDSEAYRVTYYPRADDKLVIVFVSAGRVAFGEAVEEFKRTLDGFDCSVMFVTDKDARWFSHRETPALWAGIDRIAQTYAHVATVGESMGGSGAVIAQAELTRVDRTLAMSPQYSICRPFIDFDSRYEHISRQISSHNYDNFAGAADPRRCVVLFGNLDWRDYLHSRMFAGHGFRPRYIEGAEHNLAAFLKALPGNGLVRLFGAFLDWATRFDLATVDALFPELVTDRGMHPGVSFASEATGQNQSLPAALAARFVQETGTVLGANLAVGRPATQSSLSNWSRGRTKEEDAALAVTGQVTGNYAFHTELEEEPWWQVDLGAIALIQEIRLFNYIADPGIMRRCARVRLSLSGDGTNWQLAYEREDPRLFGGSDGHPLVWRPEGATAARFVRVSAVGPTYLHLDQVQVFGTPP